MPATVKPDVSIPWGAQGQLTDPGAAKRLLGYVAEIPEFDEFNWVINNLGQYAKYLNEEGIGDYSATVTYWTGGIVKDPVTKKLYQSQQDNNTNHPLSDAAWWSPNFVGGGIRWATKTANFAAEAGRGYLVDAGRTITLPAAPLDGDEIDFADYTNAWFTTPCTVNGNGKNIEGAATYSLNVRGLFVRMVYSATTADWQVVTRAYESPHLGRATNIRLNPQIIAEDLTMLGTDNGHSVGPITIQVGNVVTINTGGNWLIS